MLLIDIKQYVKSQRLVSLAELTTRFSIDSEVVRDMLNFLIRKGTIRKKAKTLNCGVKCIKCQPAAVEMYEWIGAQALKKAANPPTN